MNIFFLSHHLPVKYVYKTFLKCLDAIYLPCGWDEHIVLVEVGG